MTDLNCIEVKWTDVRDLVAKTDKKLASLIDDIKPSKNLTLLKATYQYGDFIVKKGEFQLPTSQGTLPLKNIAMPASIQKK